MEKKFKEITELISADTSQPIITDVNVEGVVSVTCDQMDVFHIIFTE